LQTCFELLVTLLAFASIFLKQHICWYYEQCHHVNLLKKIPQKNQSINSNTLIGHQGFISLKLKVEAYF
jgi:hypothetical protein